MTTTKELAEFISLNFRVDIQVGHGEIIFTVLMSNGRRQTVLVSLIKKRDFQVIEIKSRCGVAQQAAVIRSALRRNLSTSLGGFALDTSTDPNAIDFLQRLVVPGNIGPDWQELKNTISSIAVQADKFEQRLGHEDVF